MLGRSGKCLSSIPDHSKKTYLLQKQNITSKTEQYPALGQFHQVRCFQIHAKRSHVPPVSWEWIDTIFIHSAGALCFSAMTKSLHSAVKKEAGYGKSAVSKGDQCRLMAELRGAACPRRLERSARQMYLTHLLNFPVMVSMAILKTLVFASRASIYFNPSLK